MFNNAKQWLKIFYYERLQNLPTCIKFHRANNGKIDFHFIKITLVAIYKNDVPDYHELCDTMQFNPYETVGY